MWAPCRQKVADATLWLCNISQVARDHVDMQMVDGLTGGRARVEANVVSIGSVQLVDCGANLVDQFKDVGAFS